jgi:putative Mg2+ transporter-C (MgtC) family protein
MDFLEQYYNLETLGLGELCFRFFLAIAFGFVIGFDRDVKDKPIDFRAYMIVCVATCVTALIGQELFVTYSNSNIGTGVDMGKIVSGVMTGIGFLGAGAIIHSGDTKIIGTATGASIWASGAMGLAIGFGLYVLSFICFLSLLLILVVGGWWMKPAIGRKDNGEF